MVDITNTGARPGVEVAQLYINGIASSVTTPVKELRGFARVAIEPGEFEIMVGSSSRDEDLLRATIVAR